MSHKSYYLTLTDLHAKLPLFFQPWWLNMVSNNWDIAIAKSDKGLRGIFPYCMEKKIGIQIIRNPFLTPYLSPVILHDNEIVYSDDDSSHDEILEKLWAQLPKHGSLEIETTTDFNNKHFFGHRDYSIQEKLTYELSLKPELELLFKGFHNNHRKLIRLAQDSHTIEEGLNHIDLFLSLHEKTYTRKGKKYHYDATYLTRVITTCIKENAGQLFIAKNENDEPTAFLFTVWDNKKMYLLLSAVNTETAHHGAGRLLIWHAIQVAKQKGLSVFDFEGSMDERVGNIYKRFGSERKTYLYISKVDSWIWKLKRKVLG
jgi:predicted GNAT family acetyltransferase